MATFKFKLCVYFSIEMVEVGNILYSVFAAKVDVDHFLGALDCNMLTARRIQWRWSRAFID